MHFRTVWTFWAMVRDADVDCEQLAEFGGCLVVEGGGLGWARCCWALVEMRDFLCERNDKNKEQKYYYSDRK